MLKNSCCLGILVLALAACLPDPTPFPTATSSPTPIPICTPPPSLPFLMTATPESATPTAVPCELRAQSDITVYARPSIEADVFGVLSARERVLITGRTADGWLGFDPGIAQAGNIGVFRLRWIAGDADMTLEGGCDALPLLAGTPPGVCFAMLMGDTVVFAEPMITSASVVILSTGDYARVQGKTTDSWDWFWVDLSVGNTGRDGTGWIPGAHVNLNGPCENLPVVTP